MWLMHSQFNSSCYKTKLQVLFVRDSLHIFLNFFLIQDSYYEWAFSFILNLAMFGTNSKQGDLFEIFVGFWRSHFKLLFNLLSFPLERVGAFQSWSHLLVNFQHHLFFWFLSRRCDIGHCQGVCTRRHSFPSVTRQSQWTSCPLRDYWTCYCGFDPYLPERNM